MNVSTLRNTLTIFALAGLLAACAGDATPLEELPEPDASADVDAGDDTDLSDTPDTELPDTDTPDAPLPDADEPDADTDEPDADEPDVEDPIGPILEFGNDLELSATVGESATGELAVANRGDQPLTLTLEPSDPALVLTPTSAELAADQDATIGVEVACTEPGSFTYAITLTSNDPQAPISQRDVTLSCEALPLGELVISARGLPSGTSFETTISGPGGFEASLGAPTSVPDLEPGDYTLSFAEVSAPPAIYRAEPIEVSVSAQAGTVAQADFEAIDGSLSINVTLPAGSAASFEVVDATGQRVGQFSTNGPGGATLTLAPGDHRVRLTGTAPTDAFNNPLDFEGLDQPVEVRSEQVASATITALNPAEVRTATDGQPGSLRAIVTSVNPGTEITFAPGLAPLTINQGTIAINKALSIIGQGPGQTILVADQPTGIFSIIGTDEVRFENMTLRDVASSGVGGAITANAPLTLSNLHLINNSAARGGAIAISGSGNDALLSGVFLRDNSASEEGGAIFVNGPSLVVEDTHFENNDAAVDGGAIFVENASGCGPLTLRRSLFTGNTAGTHGGAVRSGCASEVENTTFANNSATQRGGAYYQFDGAASLSFVTVTGNSAAEGAGVMSYGDGLTPMTLRASIIAGNPPTGADLNELKIVNDTGANPVASLGHNYVGRTSAGSFTPADSDTLSLTTALPSPLLSLADNGGPTHTAAVAPASIPTLSLPATSCLDAWDQPLTEDQRSQPRPDRAFCTAGAWEASNAGGFEDFENHALSDNSYSNDLLVGDDGITWVLDDARGEQNYPIDGKGIILRTGSSISAETIPGGVGLLLVDVRKAFIGTGSRTLKVYINGDLIGQTEPFGAESGEDTTVHTLELQDLNISGAFNLRLESAGEQLVVDNLRWR
ncbi:hypothetical protein FRC98_20025 [Lujinxingia vulgaris]|uniref:Uncharacterized protein n=1 Tax=Lujinxingia vulgaris TaxID=2600176 RepID=A0A5C6X101_9DELT|nr:right-handed parallel beta-helix repeat-containing protein [Lujinxingia vulgaris]TXD33893.1 hypothetical protein FRC98_20025 [Lujinxingia vulgaris]